MEGTTGCKVKHEDSSLKTVSAAGGRLRSSSRDEHRRVLEEGRTLNKFRRCKIVPPKRRARQAFCPTTHYHMLKLGRENLVATYRIGTYRALVSLIRCPVISSPPSPPCVAGHVRQLSAVLAAALFFGVSGGGSTQLRPSGEASGPFRGIASFAHQRRKPRDEAQLRMLL